MMGSHDYYRQVLRPLAFDTVEAFDKPKHYYDGKNATAAAANGYHIGGYYKKKKTPKKANSDNGIKASATVLWKELSTYPTALPIEYGSSIFVRALENQMDKVRVLIIGPEDTPYANGFFLFDVHMGHDYPHGPPRVQFLTTKSFLSAGGKKVRFNPNLYDDGKVCLSLLGTWSGPGWQAGESTLLQVLVSIQSLILGVSGPYFNEPGYANSQNTPSGEAASNKYNKNIRQYTMQVAILPFLQNLLLEYDNNHVVAAPASTTKKKVSPIKRKSSPTTTGMTNNLHFDEFKDVVKQHFKLKQQVIQKQLHQWLQEDPFLQDLYTEYWNLWDQLGQLWQSQAAASGKSRRAKVTVDAPAVKMKDGVILLDDDDDDAGDSFEADTALAIQQSLASSDPSNHAGGATKPKPKQGDEEVLEIADSDDEDNNVKPAARESVTTIDETNESCAVVAAGGRNVASGAPPVPEAAAAAATAGAVVDLT